MAHHSVGYAFATSAIPIVEEAFTLAIRELLTTRPRTDPITFVAHFLLRIAAEKHGTTEEDGGTKNKNLHTPQSGGHADTWESPRLVGKAPSPPPPKPQTRPSTPMPVPVTAGPASTTPPCPSPPASKPGMAFDAVEKLLKLEEAAVHVGRKARPTATSDAGGIHAPVHWAEGGAHGCHDGYPTRAGTVAGTEARCAYETALRVASTTVSHAVDHAVRAATHSSRQPAGVGEREKDAATARPDLAASLMQPVADGLASPPLPYPEPPRAGGRAAAARTVWCHKCIQSASATQPSASGPAAESPAAEAISARPSTPSTPASALRSSVSEPAHALVRRVLARVVQGYHQGCADSHAAVEFTTSHTGINDGAPPQRTATHQHSRQPVRQAAHTPEVAVTVSASARQPVAATAPVKQAVTVDTLSLSDSAGCSSSIHMDSPDAQTRASTPPLATPPLAQARPSIVPPLAVETIEPDPQLIDDPQLLEIDEADEY